MDCSTYLPRPCNLHFNFPLYLSLRCGPEPSRVYPNSSLRARDIRAIGMVERFTSYLELDKGVGMVVGVKGYGRYGYINGIASICTDSVVLFITCTNPKLCMAKLITQLSWIGAYHSFNQRHDSCGESGYDRLFMKEHFQSLLASETRTVCQTSVVTIHPSNYL